MRCRSYRRSRVVLPAVDLLGVEVNADSTEFFEGEPRDAVFSAPDRP